MAILKAILTSKLSVEEQLTGVMLGEDKYVTHVSDHNIILKADSTPDVEMVYSGNIPLVAGSATIDLLALTGTQGTVLATTGKKVRMIKIVAKSTNTAAVVIKEGASNGYELLGNAFQFSLLPGQHNLLYLGDSAPTLSSTVKNIDLTGTLIESIDVIITFG